MRQKILYVAGMWAQPVAGRELRLTQMFSHSAGRRDIEVAFLSEQTAIPPMLAPSQVHVLSGAQRRTGEGARPGQPLRNFVRLLNSRNTDLFRAYDPACTPRLAALVRERRYDVVQFESTTLAPYAGELRRWLPGQRIIVDCYDLEFLMRLEKIVHPALDIRNIKRCAEALNMACWERRVFQAADLTFLVNRRELSFARMLSPSSRFALVPNGIPFSPAEESKKPEISGRLIFLGSLNYPPNVDACLWFIRKMWPRIKSQCPRASLDIVGRDPIPEIESLAAMDGVRVLQNVASVAPHIAAAQAMIVPLRLGTGTRFKIIEALAAEKPVVSTRVGAAGLDLIPGKHLLQADTASEFSAATLRLLADPALRGGLSRCGRAYAMEKYDWGSIVKQVNAAYDQLWEA